MLPSLNLFKSFTCPYHAKATSSQTCERPHCQFKHPPPASSVPSRPTPAAGTSAEAVKKRKAENDGDESVQEAVSPSASAAATSVEDLIKNLPSTIENLTQALQSIQQLIKSSTAQAPAADSAAASQLTSLTSSILSTVSTIRDSSEKVAGSPSKAKPPAPAYNPTPIYELNKMKMVVEKRSDEPTPLDAKRRKLSEDAAAAAKPAAKTDVVAFSKMPLSQQVLKRYEMMNKAAPTSAAVAKAKQLKLQQASSSSASPGALAKGEQNVPQLIMDQAATSFKIPLAVRQRYLKMIFDNGKDAYGSAESACQRSAEEEKAIYDRAKSKAIYMNLVANLVKSLRSKSSTGVATSPAKPSAGYSHEAILSGPKASRVSYSINRTKQLEAKDLSETDLYKMFLKYVLTEQQLEANGFPNWTPGGAQRLAYIPNYHQTKITSNYLSKDKRKELTPAEKAAAPSTASTIVRECKRCKSTFKLLLKDLSYYPDNSQCVYHWGKMRNQRFNRAVEQKYLCCGGGTGSEGCEYGKHVYDGDYDGHGTGANITGYVETQEAKDDARHQTSRNIYSVDCEMCYTTSGLELARVSVVDINGAEAYESLVKPATEVVDYNTRWSGLNADSLKNCAKTIRDVQSDLLRLFNTDTILIGHSLDSDFKALKLIHRRVIDTTVVFPHKLGPPIKRALRTLMSEFLQKIIQEDVEGHDSKEDAVSCIQLMTWKINEDLKLTKTSSEFKKPPDTAPKVPAEPKAVLVKPAATSQYKLTTTSKPTSSSSSSSAIDANLVNAAKRVAALQALNKQLNKK